MSNQATNSGVRALSKAGSTLLRGAITLTGGTNVTLTQSGQDISIAASANVATDAIWDAKGDLAAGTGADTASKLTVGSNAQGLVAASGETTGLKWVEILPWIQTINPTVTPPANTNWSTVSQDSNYIGGGYLLSSGAQNALTDWYVILAQGTYSFEFMFDQFTNRGICTVYLDGNSIGTFNQYAASITYNQRAAITGVSVSTSGKHTLELKMGTKDAASSSYFGLINNSITITRTA